MVINVPVRPTPALEMITYKNIKALDDVKSVDNGGACFGHQPKFLGKAKMN